MSDERILTGRTEWACPRQERYVDRIGGIRDARSGYLEHGIDRREHRAGDRITASARPRAPTRKIQENEYTDRLLGFRTRRAAHDPPEGPRIGSGHILELIEYERPTAEAVPTENARVGTPDRALDVTDIDELRPKLEATGATFLPDPVAIIARINHGGRAVYLRDPDGITREHVEPSAVSGSSDTSSPGR